MIRANTRSGLGWTRTHAVVVAVNAFTTPQRAGVARNEWPALITGEARAASD